MCSIFFHENSNDNCYVTTILYVLSFNFDTVESGYLAHALIGITAKLYAPHSEVR